MRLRIPKRYRDLRRYVLTRRLAKLLGYFLWIAAFFLSALAYNDAHQTYPPEERLLGWRLALWLAVGVVSGFAVLRVWKLFTGRTVVGVILRSGLLHSYTSSEDPGAMKGADYDFRVRSALTVDTGRGRPKRLRFEQKPGFYLYYYPGTRLCRFGGLPYPVCDPVGSPRPRRNPVHGSSDAFDDPSGGCVCVACGLMNHRTNVPCANCGLTVIDPAEVFGGDCFQDD